MAEASGDEECSASARSKCKQLPSGGPDPVARNGGECTDAFERTASARSPRSVLSQPVPTVPQATPLVLEEGAVSAFTACTPGDPQGPADCPNQPGSPEQSRCWSRQSGSGLSDSGEFPAGTAVRLAEGAECPGGALFYGEVGVVHKRVPESTDAGEHYEVQGPRGHTATIAGRLLQRGSEADAAVCALLSHPLELRDGPCSASDKARRGVRFTLDGAVSRPADRHAAPVGAVVQVQRGFIDVWEDAEVVKLHADGGHDVRILTDGYVATDLRVEMTDEGRTHASPPPQPGAQAGMCAVAIAGHSPSLRPTKEPGGVVRSVLPSLGLRAVQGCWYDHSGGRWQVHVAAALRISPTGLSAVVPLTPVCCEGGVVSLRPAGPRLRAVAPGLVGWESGAVWARAPPRSADIPCSELGIGVTWRLKRGFVRAEQLAPDGAGAAAGVREGDLLGSINGALVPTSAAAAEALHHAAQEGPTVRVSWFRPGEVPADCSLVPPPVGLKPGPAEALWGGRWLPCTVLGRAGVTYEVRFSCCCGAGDDINHDAHTATLEALAVRPAGEPRCGTQPAAGGPAAEQPEAEGPGGRDGAEQAAAQPDGGGDDAVDASTEEVAQLHHRALALYRQILAEAQQCLLRAKGPKRGGSFTGRHSSHHHDTGSLGTPRSAARLPSSGSRGHRSAYVDTVEDTRTRNCSWMGGTDDGRGSEMLPMQPIGVRNKSMESFRCDTMGDPSQLAAVRTGSVTRAELMYLLRLNIPGARERLRGLGDGKCGEVITVSDWMEWVGRLAEDGKDPQGVLSWAEQVLRSAGSPACTPVSPPSQLRPAPSLECSTTVVEPVVVEPGRAKVTEPSRCDGFEGATVREGEDLASPEVGTLRPGSLCDVVEIRDRRARLAAPLRGWASVTTQEGDTILCTPIPTPCPDSCVVVKRGDETLGAELSSMVLTGVTPGSPAERAGMAHFVGRRLCRVGDTEVSSAEGAEAACAGHGPFSVCFEACPNLAVCLRKYHDDPLPLELNEDMVVVASHSQQATPMLHQRLVAVDDRPVVSPADAACLARGSTNVTLSFEVRCATPLTPVPGSRTASPAPGPATGSGATQQGQQQRSSPMSSSLRQSPRRTLLHAEGSRPRLLVSVRAPFGATPAHSEAEAPHAGPCDTTTSCTSSPRPTAPLLT
eukprot:TRINITY_DN2616_c0_g1_i1.p1 TRINITY_DN2616_c0_g1~~TRINITY_DN2616_c0_g1_i1.p1  ORF type:complete len:1264 (+),score=281.50 TRINITY_DN2616_c0_g1_i1:296-3793(+)